MTFLEAAENILRDSKAPLQVGDIWSKIEERGFHEKIGSKGKTPARTLSSGLHTDIKKENSKFVGYSRNPVLFGLKDREYGYREEDIPTPKANEKVKENDGHGQFERNLHPIFVSLAKNEFGVFCRTIMHEKTEGKTKKDRGADKWKHPDIVGVSFTDYQGETLKLASNLAYPKAELYSFELKVKVDFGNLKESYFQAVSNSSWANYGYLAVFHTIQSNVLKELEKLNARFGIGLICFGTTIDDFKVIYQARKREELDFSMMSDLESNGDFKEFAESVNHNFNADEKFRVLGKYDKILTDEEVAEHCEKHDIKRS